MTDALPGTAARYLQALSVLEELSSDHFDRSMADLADSAKALDSELEQLQSRLDHVSNQLDAASARWDSVQQQMTQDLQTLQNDPGSAADWQLLAQTQAHYGSWLSHLFRAQGHCLKLQTGILRVYQYPLLRGSGAEQTIDRERWQCLSEALTSLASTLPGIGTYLSLTQAVTALRRLWTSDVRFSEAIIRIQQIVLLKAVVELLKQGAITDVGSYVGDLEDTVSNIQEGIQLGDATRQTILSSARKSAPGT